MTFRTFYQLSFSAAAFLRPCKEPIIGDKIAKILFEKLTKLNLNGLDECVVDEDVLLLRLHEVVPLTPDVLQKPEHVQRLLQLDLKKSGTV